jgi:hypothetical protein
VEGEETTDGDKVQKEHDHKGSGHADLRHLVIPVILGRGTGGEAVPAAEASREGTDE